MNSYRRAIHSGFKCFELVLVKVTVGMSEEHITLILIRNLKETSNPKPSPYFQISDKYYDKNGKQNKTNRTKQK